MIASPVMIAMTASTPTSSVSQRASDGRVLGSLLTQVLHVLVGFSQVDLGFGSVDDGDEAGRWLRAAAGCCGGVACGRGDAASARRLSMLKMCARSR